MSKSMKKVSGLLMAAILVCAFSAMPAFAADQDVDVNGSIGIVDNTGDPDPLDPTYSMTIPTSVNWYVTEYSYQQTPNVWNTNTATNSTNPNSIVNTNGVNAQYVVTFEGFEYATGNTAGASVASDLTLNLTGDLAADGIGSQDLSGEYTPATAVTYTATLQPGAANAWTFGFTGQYTGGMTTTAVTPTYVMTLGFALL